MNRGSEVELLKYADGRVRWPQATSDDASKVAGAGWQTPAASARSADTVTAITPICAKDLSEYTRRTPSLT